MPNKKGNNPGKPKKRKPGRPPMLNDEIIKRVEEYSFLGATEPQMAGFIGVSEVTFWKWKKKSDELVKAIRAGREADSQVAKSLYKRAIGYAHPAVKIFQVGGSTIEHKYIERYAPDVAAAKFILTNRHGGIWRDRIIQDGTTVAITVPVEHDKMEALLELTDEELATVLKVAERLQAAGDKS